MQLSKQALMRSIADQSLTSGTVLVSQVRLPVIRKTYYRVSYLLFFTTLIQKDEESDASADISDLLNEALEEPEESTPPKQQKKTSSRVPERAVPLYHSVSTYRKQQQVIFTFVEHSYPVIAST